LSSWPEGGKKEKVMAVIKAGSLDTNNPVHENIPENDQLFPVDEFDDILFFSHRVEWRSKTKAELYGELTLHGITRPVIFHVNLTVVDESTKVGERSESVLARAGASIHRSDFGAEYFHS
jgi:polyisoprenoid-binding protein YceI